MTADAMATVAPEVRHYFASNVSETGTRMLAAWESGIKDSLGLVKGLVQSSQPRERQANRIPDSDARLLEYLRQNKGRITGTQRIIAEAVGMPPSTLNASVARLVSRNLIARGRRSIALVDREV